jgi:hypothetical protein
MATKFMIPGLGVNYTSPAVTPRSNAVNIRQTGATAGEAGRFANMAPAGTTTRPMSQPASANSALGLGGPAQSIVPPSLSSTRAPSPVPTLIPANLDAAGRAGGAGITTTPTGGVRATGSGVNTNTLEGILAASGPSVTAPGGGSSEPGLPATGGARDPKLGQPIDSTSKPVPEKDAAPDGAAPGGATSDINVAAELDSAIRRLLDPEFIDFQGDRASELRRLQNLRNQLFGDAEMGQTGSIQRQEDLDLRDRRRLAAQRASAGMLQGGAFFGRERGLGVVQQADQRLGIEEMKRPFNEQTAADRLREFGLEFDPNSRVFDQVDYSDILPEMRLNEETGEYEYVPKEGSTGRYFGVETQAGRAATARARAAAIQQLAQRGIQI